MCESTNVCEKEIHNYSHTLVNRLTFNDPQIFRQNSKNYIRVYSAKRKKIIMHCQLKCDHIDYLFFFLSSVKCHRSGQDERVFCYCTYTHPIPSKTTINCVTLSVDSFFYIFFFFFWLFFQKHSHTKTKKSHTLTMPNIYTQETVLIT